MKKNNLSFFLIFILTPVLFFIYVPIFDESISLKQLDFQWSPSKLVSEGINHYEYMLNGNRDKIIGSQFGEYLHGLYILFYPFTIFNWETAKILWFVFNFFIAIIIPILICKKYKIPIPETILITFFFLTCSVTKAHMVIGQQSIFILFFFCLPFVSNSKISYFLSGISYLKYSIGYVLFLDLIFKKKINFIFLSLIVPFIGWLLYSYATHSNLIESIFQPFKLAIQNHLISNEGVEVMPKNIFLLSFFEFFEFKNKSFIALVISIILNAYFIFKIRNFENQLQKLACILLSTLIFFPHYPHNFVLLLPLLIFSVKKFNTLTGKISFFASIYFLSFFRAVEIYVPLLITNEISRVEIFIKYLNIIFLFFILLINIYEDKIYYIKKYKLKI